MGLISDEMNEVPVYVWVIGINEQTPKGKFYFEENETTTNPTDTVIESSELQMTTGRQTTQKESSLS